MTGILGLVAKSDYLLFATSLWQGVPVPQNDKIFYLIMVM